METEKNKHKLDRLSKVLVQVCDDQTDDEHAKLKVLTTGEMNYDTQQPGKPTMEETMTQAPTRILIKLHQGNVQAVGCSAPNAHVVIVDWDTDGSNPHDQSLVRIDHPYAPFFARVYRFPTCSLNEFQGTDVERALGVKELSSFSNL